MLLRTVGRHMISGTDEDDSEQREMDSTAEQESLETVTTAQAGGDERAATVRIQYGGSANAKNAPAPGQRRLPQIHKFSCQ